MDLDLPKKIFLPIHDLLHQNIGSKVFVRTRSFNFKPKFRVTILLPRKEVIHPHVPVRIPCYDLALITGSTLGPTPYGTGTSSISGSSDLTGSVYKARERIHRNVADLRLLAIPTS